MGLQLKRGPAEQQKRRRTGALLLNIDDFIGDLVAVATIREQVRLFGVDRVRGL
jgi:hypothetical protein